MKAFVIIACLLLTSYCQFEQVLLNIDFNDALTPLQETKIVEENVLIPLFRHSRKLKKKISRNYPNHLNWEKNNQ